MEGRRKLALNFAGLSSSGRRRGLVLGETQKDQNQIMYLSTGFTSERGSVLDQGIAGRHGL